MRLDEHNGFTMQEQIQSLTTMAEQTIERLEDIARLRKQERRQLSVARRMDLLMLRNLLDRINTLIWSGL